MKASRDPHRVHFVISTGNACSVPVFALHAAFVHRFNLSFAIRFLSE